MCMQIPRRVGAGQARLRGSPTNTRDFISRPSGLPRYSLRQMIRRDYLIVGAGIGGVSACEGIREHDRKGSIMLVGAEVALPYHRPRLFPSILGRSAPAPEKALIHEAAWFTKNHVDLRLD